VVGDKRTLEKQRERAENRRIVSGSQATHAHAPIVLKSDVFGRIERVESRSGTRVNRVACGSRVPFSRFLARRLMERERAALERLADLDGVPRILATDGCAGVLVRSYVEGAPLSQARELPENFFDELDVLVEAVHARGVCHNDLHKEQNVLVGADGRPWLLDFQLASCHARETRTFAARAREDLRHVEKHRRRYTRDGRGPRGERTFGRGADARRSMLARVWRKTGKRVYNAIVHTLFRRPPSEARRSSAGPWPRWTPAVGPRARNDALPGAADARP
jgi:RIO-like serine/threonine protein kinase